MSILFMVASVIAFFIMPTVVIGAFTGYYFGGTLGCAIGMILGASMLSVVVTQN